jgi:hypothetical protein
LISPLTHEAIRIATVKNQLDEFFGCWLSQPLVGGDLVPFEQTLMSKFFRLGLTGLVVLNIFVFVLLFIIPEFQKMYEEFGLEMTPASQFLILWSDRFVKLWFIPFFLVLVLGFFFFRGPSFADWWRRWSSRLWTAQNWNRKDRDRLVTAWELRPMKDTETQKCAGASISAESNSTATIARWHETSFAGVLSKSESFALAATNDQELKDWLLEKMIKSKRERRALRRNVWGTILFGVGHCAIGLLVFLVALSVFGSLLEIVHGLAGGRP